MGIAQIEFKPAAAEIYGSDAQNKVVFSSRRLGKTRLMLTAGIAAPDSSHNHFVQILYQHCLYRSADAKGLGFWIDQLDSGRQDRVDVLIGFANSSENIALQETLA